MDNNSLMRTFSASEAAAVQTRLWGLLQRQVQHYTMAESSSVPVEVAQELLKGVNYLLRQGLQGAGKTARRSCCMEIWMRSYSVGWNGWTGRCRRG